MLGFAFPTSSTPMARKPKHKPRSKSDAKKRANAGRHGRGRSADIGQRKRKRASEQAANRRSDGRFEKGASGNPGGRPKEDERLKELARLHTEDAIERLAHWMNSANAKASVAACNALLDRAWGKASQAITGPGGGPLDVNVNEVRGAIAGKLDRIASAIEKASVSRKP